MLPIRMVSYGTARNRRIRYAGASVNVRVSQERIRWNQIGAYHNYFCEGSDGFPLMAGFPGEPATPALGADIELAERNADFASSRMRSVVFCTTPRSRNGIAVAATSSFARRGVLASGSQRKSCADRKKVRQAQTARERTSTYRLPIVAEFTMVC